MSKYQRLLVAGILAGGALLPSVARAGVLFSYVTDQTTYNAAAGATVNVQVFLKETLTTPSTSLINSDGGLSGYGVALNRTTSPTNAAFFGSFVNNAALFGGSSSSDIASLTHVGGFTSISTSQAGATTTINEILLGTAMITAGGAGTTTLFTVGEHDTGGQNTLTKNNFYDLDFSSGLGGNPTSPAFTGVGSATETFSVVVSAPAAPEPASLGVLAIGATALLARRRRRA